MRKFFFLSVLMVFFTGSIFGQAPTVQASAVAISNVSQTQFDINWTRGDGGSCIVVVYQGMLGTPTITDATTYTAGTVFGDGSECGTGWYCVYNGTGTTVTVTGLTVNSNYLVYAYEYNGAAGTEEYLTTVVSNFAFSYTLPEIYDVTGGGSYCQGATPTGVDVSLSGSETGVDYQLKKDGVDEGSVVAGTGSSLTWSDLTAGTYTIVATNTTGNADMNGNAVVTENSLPTATASSNSPVCEGYSIDLTGGPGSMTTYAWSGPNGFTSADQNPSILIATSVMAGTYTVVVTDGNGCTGSTTTDVVVNSLPTATAASNSPVCESAQIDLTGGPGSMTTYAWSGPNGYTSTDQSPSISTATSAMAGTYTVVVTDGNGCTGSTTTDVVVNSLPTATASSNSPVCEGSQLDLAGGPVSMTLYSWFGPNGFTSNTQSPIVSMSATSAMVGTYTIVITDGNGCTNSATTDVTVNAIPLVTASSNSPVCEGSQIDLNGTGAMSTYAWSGPNGFTSTVQNPTISPATSAMAGTYTIVVTDGNGCTNSATTSVAVTSGPTATAISNSPVCEGSSLILIGGPGAMTSYAWSGPDGYTSTVQISTVSSFATNAMAGTYTLVVTDAIGCTNSATTDVIVNTMPSVIVSSNSPVCEGTSLSLTGDPAAMIAYSWSGPNSYSDASQNPTVSSSATTGMTGIYTLAVTDNNGCTNSASTYVEVVVLPIASATCNSPICEDSPLNMTGGPYAMASYVWSGPNSYSDSTQSPTISLFADSTMIGTYTLVVTDSNGCTSSATTDVVVTNHTTASFTGLAEGYCIYADTSTLVPTPTGGTFAGEGITSDYFVPSDAGAGIYEITYTYTDTNGCANIVRDTTEVFALPVIPIDTLSRACDTVAILDAGSGYASYYWSNGSTAQTLTVYFDGTYRVTVTDIHGCMNNVTTVLNLDTKLVLTVPDTVNSCRGSNSIIIATGTSGSSFTWNDSITSTNISVSPMTEQYYYVVMNNVTNYGTCVAEDSVLVIPHDPPVVTLPATISNCGKLILDPGSGPGEYTWTGWTHNPTLMVLASGTYSVTVTNSDGCSATGTSNVTILPPVVYLGGDITIALNQTVVLGTSPGYDYYSWSTGSTGYSISITGSDLGIGSHDIWCMAGINGGCETSDTITVNVTWASDVTEINSGSITVYPNPSRERIFIVSDDGTTPEEITVFNLLGQKVISDVHTNNIDVTALPSGLYTMIMKFGNNKTVQKNIVVEK